MAKATLLGDDNTDHPYLSLLELITLGKLGAIVFHEITNPVLSAKATIENIKTNLPLKVKDHSTLNQIDHLQFCLDSIQELLSLYKQPQRFDTEIITYDHLAKNIKLLDHKANLKRVKISLDCPKNIMILNNPFLLRLIVINLLANAIEAFPPYKTRSSSIKRLITLRVESLNSSSTIIRVTDNAPCTKQFKIPPEIQSRNQFTKTDKSFPHLGLGLCLVKTIVSKLLNGKFEVETSQLYTTCTILL